MIRTLLILLSLLAMMAGCSDHDDALPDDGYPTETAPLPHPSSSARFRGAGRTNSESNSASVPKRRLPAASRRHTP